MKGTWTGPLQMFTESHLSMLHARFRYDCYRDESLMNVIGTSHLKILYGRVTYEFYMH